METKEIEKGFLDKIKLKYCETGDDKNIQVVQWVNEEKGVWKEIYGKEIIKEQILQQLTDQMTAPVAKTLFGKWLVSFICNTFNL